MKKLFLLIIASWATSCLPDPGPERFLAQKLTKAFTAKTLSSKIDELTQAKQALTETNKKLEKEKVLDQSFYHGTLSGSVGIGVPAGCAYFSVITFLSVPFVAIGFGTAVACSLLQDMYRTSKDDKKNTTSNERVFAHAKGIGSVGAVTFLGGLAQKHLNNPE